jgi:hypothetical protein
VYNASEWGIDMSAFRTFPSWLLGAALAATSVAALAQDDDEEPDKGGRLSVSVTQVGPKVPVQQPLQIGSRLTWTGGKATFTYAWSSVAGTALPAALDDTASSLEIPAHGLAAGGSYHLRLDVVATTERGMEVKASREVKFKANQPPKDGSCKVSAKAVQNGILQITLSAPGWIDPDGQVQYRFEILNGKKVLAVQNWRAFTSFAVTVRPKPGDVLLGRCGIRDELGDGTTLETAAFDGAGTG